MCVSTEPFISRIDRTPTMNPYLASNNSGTVPPCTRDGTGSPGHGSPGQRFSPGRVGSRVSVSDPTFDPVLSFNMRVYRGVVSTE